VKLLKRNKIQKNRIKNKGLMMTMKIKKLKKTKKVLEKKKIKKWRK
jgi:hypothetical protein